MCSETSCCQCRSARGDSCARSRSGRATPASSITPTRCRIAAAWAAARRRRCGRRLCRHGPGDRVRSLRARQPLPLLEARDASRVRVETPSRGRIEPGTDLILNLHLRTTGKPEQVRPSLGLYFTDRAPTVRRCCCSSSTTARSTFPPGAGELYRHRRARAAGGRAACSRSTRTRTTSRARCAPSPGVPTAHRVARAHRRLEPGLAGRLRAGDPAVAAARQRRCRCAGPTTTPRANERNPHTPPRRVTAGNRASDEMSHLWLQVLPERREDLPLLQEALMRARLRKYPGRLRRQRQSRERCCSPRTG